MLSLGAPRFLFLSFNLEEEDDLKKISVRNHASAVFYFLLLSYDWLMFPESSPDSAPHFFVIY